MDEPFTDAEMEGIQGLQAMRDRVLKATGKKNPTVRDFITGTGRGRLRSDMVGGPKEVADKMEEWFTEGACDGFVVAATHVPGAYEEFVQHVVPELQRRGIYRKDYTGPHPAGPPRPAARHPGRLAGEAGGGIAAPQAAASSRARSWKNSANSCCWRRSSRASGRWTGRRPCLGSSSSMPFGQ